MDETTRARAFDPFFTTKQEAHGTGMGLAQVYGIVTQTGGHVTLTSEPGRGTEVTVFLPPAPPGATAAEKISERPPRARDGAGRTVLVVEDHEDVRATLARGLEEAGFRVLTAGSAEEALCRARAAQVDVLVTDVVMPGGGGIELACDYLRLQPTVRVILVSGDVRDHDVSSLPDHVRWLQKLFPASRLVGLVQDLLGVGGTD